MYLYRPESQIQAEIYRSAALPMRFQHTLSYVITFHPNSSYTGEQKRLVPALGRDLSVTGCNRSLSGSSSDLPARSSGATACPVPVNWMSGCLARLAVKTCNCVCVVNWLEKGLNYLQRCCLPGLTEYGGLATSEHKRAGFLNSSEGQ